MTGLCSTESTSQILRWSNAVWAPRHLWRHWTSEAAGHCFPVHSLSYPSSDWLSPEAPLGGCWTSSLQLPSPSSNYWSPKTNKQHGVFQTPTKIEGEYSTTNEDSLASCLRQGSRESSDLHRTPILTEEHSGWGKQRLCVKLSGSEPHLLSVWPWLSVHNLISLGLDSITCKVDSISVHLSYPHWVTMQTKWLKSLRQYLAHSKHCLLNERLLYTILGHYKYV